jgi:hypothetical protein
LTGGRERATVPIVRAVLALLLVALAAIAAYQLQVPIPVDLMSAERSRYSPGGEDGVLEAIFERLPPRHRYLVDLGAGYGESGSCSRNLLMEHRWRGLLMEPDEAAATELAARYEGVPGVVTRGAS